VAFAKWAGINIQEFDVDRIIKAYDSQQRAATKILNKRAGLLEYREQIKKKGAK
jgi:hypothetical protein